MNMRKGLIAIAAASVLLAGCANTGNGPGEFGANKTTAGGLLGAVAGGLAGSQIGKGRGQLVAVGAGTLLGALVGSEVGKSLDKADQQYAQRAHQQAQAAPLGQTDRVVEPAIRSFRRRDAGARGPDSGDRRVLPRVPAIGPGRRPAAERLRHRLPPGRWQLARRQLNRA